MSEWLTDEELMILPYWMQREYQRMRDTSIVLDKNDQLNIAFITALRNHMVGEGSVLVLLQSVQDWLAFQEREKRYTDLDLTARPATLHEIQKIHERAGDRMFSKGEPRNMVEVPRIEPDMTGVSIVPPGYIGEGVPEWLVGPKKETPRNQVEVPRIEGGNDKTQS